MRTTLDIDDAVLDAVKELGRRQGKTTGEVLSTLARQAHDYVAPCLFKSGR